MNSNLDFKFVDKEIRKKTFGILTTTNPDGTPHTTGVLYGVSPPNSDFFFFILTSSKYKKAINIRSNANISFIIPFPHHMMRFVPSGTILINGKAQIVPIKDEILEIFSQKNILRMIIKDVHEKSEDWIFLKIIPHPKILCYAVGMSIWKLRGSHAEGGYSLLIPEDRREK